MSPTESFLGGIAFKNRDYAAVTTLIVSGSQSLTPGQAASPWDPSAGLGGGQHTHQPDATPKLKVGANTPP